MTDVIALDWGMEIKKELYRHLYKGNPTDAYLLETESFLFDIEEETINHKPGFTSLQDAKDFAVQKLQQLKTDLEIQSVKSAIYYTYENSDCDVEDVELIVNAFTENRYIR